MRINALPNGILCKANFHNNFTVTAVAEEVELLSRFARLFCKFSLLEECVILFCNIVYVYVCKICEEKVGWCWWSFSWLGQKVKDSMHSSCRSSRLRYVIMLVKWHSL